MPVFADKIIITPENIDSIFSLPTIPVEQALHQEITPDKTITILPNECTFVLRRNNEAGPSAVITKYLRDSFIILKGEDDKQNGIFFCIHMDSFSKPNIDKYLLQLCSKEITAVIIGVVDDKTGLERVIKCLIQTANQYNLNITITRQRLGKHFVADELSYYHFFNLFALEKAMLIYKKLFNKPLPQKLAALRFNADYVINPSPIQGFEKALKEIEKINIEYAKDITKKSQILKKFISYAEIIQKVDKNNFFGFCTFLIEENPLSIKPRFIENRVNFASSEILFNYIYKALFCRNGYDALRLTLALNNSMPHCLAPEIGFNFETMKVFRAPYFYYEGEYAGIRLAKIFFRENSDSSYHECYKAGKYQKPLLTNRILSELQACAHLLQRGGKALEMLAEKIQLNFPGISPKQERIFLSVIEDYMENSVLYEAEEVAPVNLNENNVVKTHFRFTDYIASELKRPGGKSSSFLVGEYFSNLKKCKSSQEYIQQLKHITGVKFIIKEDLHAVFTSSCTEELHYVKKRLEEKGINCKIGVDFVEIANIESCDLQFKLMKEQGIFSV